ncbi:transposase [Streptomyces sp. NBC_01619]|uniref:transposase n=1 Tax=Streptomyces sp. NBC_01619 TaxID=2975901 RepID=UPI00338F5A87
METIERAVKMYRTADPKPLIQEVADDLDVHPEALRGWIRQDEEDRREREDQLIAVEHAESAGRGASRHVAGQHSAGGARQGLDVPGI